MSGDIIKEVENAVGKGSRERPHLHEGEGGSVRGVRRGGYHGQRADGCAGDGNPHGGKGGGSGGQSRNRRGHDRACDPGSPYRPAGRNHNHPEGGRADSQVHLGHWPIWRAGVIIALACLFLFGSCLRPASAHAVTLEADMTQLGEDLEANPELDDFSGFSAEHQLEDEQALGSVEWLEELFTGTEMASGDLDHGAGGPNFSKVEEFLKGLETEYDSAAADGSIDGAIGGEVADLASAGGILTAGASSALAVIPIGALLTYEDISSGSNIVSRALFSGTEDNSKVEANGGVGAEGMRWQYFPPCPTSAPYSGAPYSEIECVFSSPAGETYRKDTGASEYAHGPTGNEPRSGQYLIEAKISGEWYPGLQACLQGSVGPFGGELTSWPEWDEEGVSGDPCNDATPGTKVAGWPQNLQRVATFLYFGTASDSGSRTSVFGPGDYYYRENDKQYITEASVIGERSPSRMHESIPHKISAEENSKLEDEGRVSYKGEAEGLNKERLGPGVKAMAKHMKEGGQRRMEQGVCHVVECELEAKGSEPSSPVEPEVPGKEAGDPPPEPGLEEVPSCTSPQITGTQCVELLETDGFTKVEIDVETWEHANVGQAAEAALGTDPSTGSRVETNSTITVHANPAADEMPLVIPAPATHDELGTEYQKELESDGFTKTSISVRPEVDIDPEVGPNDVASTAPAEGTATNPDGDTPVKIEDNPSNAPAGETAPGIGPPSLPGFDIPNFGVLCKGFPFGVPCWLANTIKSWSATAVAPEWGIDSFTIQGHTIPGYHMSLSPLEPIMEYARPAMLIFATIGVVLLFYRLAKGGSPESGGGIQDTGTSGTMPAPDEDVYL